MWKLVLLVLDDPTKLDDVLHAWEEIGIPGATIIESSGLARRRGYLRDDTPLFPSISSLLESNKRHNFTIFTVIDDKVEIDALLEQTEKVTGNLENPRTGMLICAPLSFAKGTIYRNDST